MYVLRVPNPFAVLCTKFGAQDICRKNRLDSEWVNRVYSSSCCECSIAAAVENNCVLPKSK